LLAVATAALYNVHLNAAQRTWTMKLEASDASGKQTPFATDMLRRS